MWSEVLINRGFVSQGTAFLREQGGKWCLRLPISWTKRLSSSSRELPYVSSCQVLPRKSGVHVFLGGYVFCLSGGLEGINWADLVSQVAWAERAICIPGWRAILCILILGSPVTFPSSSELSFEFLWLWGYKHQSLHDALPPVLELSCAYLTPVCTGVFICLAVWKMLMWNGVGILQARLWPQILITPM